MANKRYVITEDLRGLEVTLEVDHDVLTPERAEEINNFWIEPDARLAAAADDVVRAVILMAARFLMHRILADAWGSVRGLQDEFDEAEGWGGRAYNGITLIDFDGAPEIELHDLELVEVEVGS
jgi:hypothetical protein